MNKEFTCIVCPVSCSLMVYEENENIIVEGNSCNRGIKFGEDEFTNPKRILTTTVKISGSHLERLPVISSDEIPKDEIIKLMQELYKMTVEAPVTRGQILLKDVCGSGINIIASRSLKLKTL